MPLVKQLSNGRAGINCFVRNVAFRFEGCGLWLRKPTGGMGEG